MTVLDRSELQASPLADLHLIADQIGLEGFRRLRKADLIDAILGEKGEGAVESDATASGEEAEAPQRDTPTRRVRAPRSRRASSAAKSSATEDEQKTQAGDGAPAARRGRSRTEREKSNEPESDAEGVVEVLGNGSGFLARAAARALRWRRIHLRRTGASLRARLGRSCKRAGACA